MCVIELISEMKLASLPHILEGAMLLFFSASWPVKIEKLLRAKRSDGLSPVFLSMIIAGYVCGFVAKLFTHWGEVSAPQLLTALYAINGAMVSAALVLTLRYRDTALPIADSLTVTGSVVHGEVIHWTGPTAVHPGEPTDEEVRQLVTAGRDKGWATVRFIGGSADFQGRARQEALREGYRTEQISLECEDAMAPVPTIAAPSGRHG